MDSLANVGKIVLYISGRLTKASFCPLYSLRRVFCLAISNSLRSNSEGSGPTFAGSMIGGICGGSIGTAITVATNIVVRRQRATKYRILKDGIRTQASRRMGFTVPSRSRERKEGMEKAKRFILSFDLNSDPEA